MNPNGSKYSTGLDQRQEFFQDFRQAIFESGLTPPDEVIADGAIHRFSSSGKPGDDAGWYTLHLEGNTAYGKFGCWRSGIEGSWRSAKKAAIAQDRVNNALAHNEAAERAGKLLAKARPADSNHRYLQSKRIPPGPALQLKDFLILKIEDTNGKVRSVQFIKPDGAKRLLKGGEKKACFIVVAGNWKTASTICIAEGFATATTAHELLKPDCTIAAIDCGNLEPVARAIRQARPNALIRIVADDDRTTGGNPGLKKAREAAEAVKAELIRPRWPAGAPLELSDLNDLVNWLTERGENIPVEELTVTEKLEDEILKKIGVTGVTGVTENEKLSKINNLYEGEAVTPDKNAGVTGVTANKINDLQLCRYFPPAEKRPSWVVLDDWTEIENKKWKPGTYFCAVVTEGRGENKQTRLTNTWVCGPLYIEAQTFDEDGNNFGRILRFKTSIGTWRTIAVPMEMLRGSGEELRGLLLSLGLLIDPAHRAKLHDYILGGMPPTKVVTCTNQTGWLKGNFVLPGEVIGPNPGSVIYQNGGRPSPDYSANGDLKIWKEEIGRLASNNPMMLLAVSCAFAGPLLRLVNAESGGIHFIGESSIGKTTLLEVARSVWGGEAFKRTWRATANGLEGAAAIFNDSLLILDEIGECDPRDVGKVVYFLGNGVGKQRADKLGNARILNRWRCFVLSSGELTIATTIKAAGTRARAGQEVRLLDIPAKRKYGVFDELHNFPDGRSLADRLKTTAARHYGFTGREFLRRLTDEKEDLKKALAEIREFFEADPNDGQACRAASKFALIALAGELATTYDLTGWKEGEAIDAALLGFQAWLDLKGDDRAEDSKILEAITDFIDRHGDARFSNIDEGEVIVRDRAGWWRDNNGNRLWLFTSEGLRDALRGYDFNLALDVLERHGWLERGNNRNSSRVFKVGGRPVRLYQVTLGEDEL